MQSAARGRGGRTCDRPESGLRGGRGGSSWGPADLGGVVTDTAQMLVAGDLEEGGAAVACACQAGLRRVLGGTRLLAAVLKQVV